MRGSSQPNDERRSVTMEDVAERAGVSRALVSIVFRGVPGASDENRAKVMKAAEELSYRLDQRARLLGRKHSQTIGITFRFHDDAHTGLVEDLYRAADTVGYHLVLSPVTAYRPERVAAESLFEYRCEAIILLAPNLTGDQLTAIAERVHTIVVGRRVGGRCSVVRKDDELGARLATDHLMQLGHQRIAHVHGNRLAGAKERVKGYRNTMRAAGLDKYVELIPGGMTEEDGSRAADLLARRDGPTAVYVYNDQCAAGLIARLREHNISVPGQISVVGNDNSRLAGSASLQLTTIAQTGHELARHALQLAVRTERSNNDPVEIVVPPHLIVRSTTAAAQRT